MNRIESAASRSVGAVLVASSLGLSAISVKAAVVRLDVEGMSASCP